MVLGCWRHRRSCDCGSVMGLHPITPVAIQRHTNLPRSTQVIDCEEYLVPRELRTEIHHLFQRTIGAELIQHILHPHDDCCEYHTTPLMKFPIPCGAS